MKEKQMSEIRFKVPSDLHDAFKKAADIYGQPIGSFARHLLVVSFRQFQKDQELKLYSFGDEEEDGEDLTD